MNKTNQPISSQSSQALPKKLPAFIWFFLKPYKWALCISILTSLAWTAEMSLSPYFLKLIIDGVVKTANTPKLMLSTILIPVLLYASMSIWLNLIFRLYDYSKLTVFPKLKASVATSIFTELSAHSPTFFANQLAGNLSKKIFDLSTGIEPLILIPNEIFIPRTFALIIASMFLYSVHPIFALILILWSIGFVGCAYWMAKRSVKYAYALSQTDNILGGKVVDSLSNIISTKLFSNLPYEKSVITNATHDLIVKDKALHWYLLKTYFVQGLWVTVLITSMLTALIYQRLDQAVTVGDFVLILNIATVIIMNIWNIGQEMIKFSKEIGKCQQALSLIINHPEIQDSPTAKPLNITKGGIIFDNVQFEYKNAAPIFQNKTISILPGQKVGLVGHSGSGKSTFVNLILRLFDVQNGRILIDGQDIKFVTQDSLRQAIGMIPQDPSLFHRSLIDNIRYGKINATDEDVIHAAKQAHAHEFINQLPETYQTLVGERGIKLSGGQRQRIAIARAFLKNAPILILDEATSQLDSVTENYIQDSLWALMQNKTTLVIAHRLSTLLHMDRILVFKQGKIIEDGTHQTLLAQNGHYKALWDAQIGGFLLDTDTHL